MKKTVLSLLLVWIAIYASNHLLFKSVPKNSEIETLLRSQPDSGTKVDSWGPYLPGVRAKDDQKSNGLALNAGQKAEANQRSHEGVAEKLASSQPSEQPSEEKLPAKIPPTPAKKPEVVGSDSSAFDRKSSALDAPPSVAAKQNRKIVGQQKTRVAHDTAKVGRNLSRSGRSSPEEAWFPGARPKTGRFAENKPAGAWSPGPAPRRWRSGMFMFAPPGF